MGGGRGVVAAQRRVHGQAHGGERDRGEGVESARDALGPEAGQLHVVRGASWRSVTVTDLHMSARSYGADAREDIGFRVARNLE